MHAGRAAEQVAFAALVLELGTGHAGDVEVHDVRLHAFEVARDARQLGQSLGQGAGVGVVVGEAVHHRLQRDDPGRCENARLAHAAAEALAPAPCLLDRLAAAAEDASGGASQSL